MHTQKQKVILTHHWLLGRSAETPSEGSLFHHLYTQLSILHLHIAATALLGAIQVIQPVVDANVCWQPCAALDSSGLSLSVLANSSGLLVSRGHQSLGNFHTVSS